MGAMTELPVAAVPGGVREERPAAGCFASGPTPDSRLDVMEGRRGGSRRPSEPAGITPRRPPPARSACRLARHSRRRRPGRCRPVHRAVSGIEVRTLIASPVRASSTYSVRCLARASHRAGLRGYSSDRHARRPTSERRLLSVRGNRRPGRLLGDADLAGPRNRARVIRLITVDAEGHTFLTSDGSDRPVTLDGKIDGPRSSRPGQCPLPVEQPRGDSTAFALTDFIGAVHRATSHPLASITPAIDGGGDFNGDGRTDLAVADAGRHDSGPTRPFRGAPRRGPVSLEPARDCPARRPGPGAHPERRPSPSNRDDLIDLHVPAGDLLPRVEDPAARASTP